jgi:hypothetical protein
MTEEQMWDTLKKIHRNPNLPVPAIENKPVNVYTLFTLVHRNGGSAKVSRTLNSTMIPILRARADAD